jgi:hypothetical protein
MIALILALVLAAPPISGTASWYPADGMIAAAGPALRHGDWRGSRITVSSGGRSVTVTLSDWCQCYGSRVIDLSDDAFRKLAPLSKGLLRVTVSRETLATLPPTDTDLLPTPPATVTLRGMYRVPC